MNKNLKITSVSLAIAGIIGLTACGGGGSGSDSSTPTTGSMITSGVVTGFGSVFVDGVEFETDSSSFSLDDGDDGIEDEDGLAVGMVVTVTGTVNADGKTGTAKHIEFDDELEGIVNANYVAADGTGTMTVMGQAVIIKTTTIFESDVAAIDSVDKVAAGNVVEVSGFSTGDGTVYATRIEVKRATHAGEEIEVKGIITNLAAGTFDLGGLTVDFSSALFDDSLPDATLSDGQYVEVKSTAGFNLEDELIASEIELQDDGDMDLEGDDGDDVGLNGIVTAVKSDTVFEIGGHTIIITNSTSVKHGNADDIIVGIYLETEGELNANGELLADEIELGIDDDIGMEGSLEGVNGPPGTVTLFGRTIHVNASTLLLDKRDEEGLLPEHFFGLDDLNSGDTVEIDAYVEPGSDKLIAVKLERDDDNDDEDELEGPVESVPDANTLVIAGVTVDVSGIAVPAIAAGDEVEVVGSYSTGTSVFTATQLGIDD
ncbi:MAG: DUF5666 domain-containing protein [Gammaproteobacteria bacterium]|jgi:hypothetical protein